MVYQINGTDNYVFTSGQNKAAIKLAQNNCVIFGSSFFLLVPPVFL